jgi:hypothetical protein
MPCGHPSAIASIRGRPPVCRGFGAGIAAIGQGATRKESKKVWARLGSSPEPDTTLSR